MTAGLQLSGKKTLISGVGSGIGFELALQLLAEGAGVIGTDIDPDGLEKLVAAAGSGSAGRLATYVVDHTDRGAVEALAAEVRKTQGPPDILCCNVGIGHSGRIGEIPLAEWETVVNLNFWAQIYLINLFLPAMRARRSGSILISASGAGLFPIAGMAPYNCTKSAMVSLAHTMRMELAGDNIGVSTLCPGIINTNIIHNGIITGNKNRETALKIYQRFGAHPRIVAAAAIRGLKKNRATIRTPLYHVFPTHLLYRFWPGLFLALGTWLYGRGWNFIGPLVKPEPQPEKQKNGE